MYFFGSRPISTTGVGIPARAYYVRSRPMAAAQGFTFAVVGRNEAERLAGIVGLALEAAQPGDRVWFVDSASEDDSIAVARGLGVDEVIEGPEGKGRAMDAALDRCESR